MIMSIGLLVIIAFCAGYFAGTGHNTSELDELTRWRCYWHETRAWLAEFKDSVEALEHLNEVARGKNGSSIDRVREAMRRRRDEAK